MTSLACARKISASILLSMRCGSFTHLDSTESWIYRREVLVLFLERCTFTYLLHQATLDHIIAQRMCRHIEEQKILLFRCEHTLLHQILGQTFAYIFKLVAQFQWIPSFTCHNKQYYSKSSLAMIFRWIYTTEIFNPALNRLWGICFLNVF